MGNCVDFTFSKWFDLCCEGVVVSLIFWWQSLVVPGLVWNLSPGWCGVCYQTNCYSVTLLVICTKRDRSMLRHAFQNRLKKLSSYHQISERYKGSIVLFRSFCWVRITNFVKFSPQFQFDSNKILTFVVIFYLLPSQSPSNCAYGQREPPYQISLLFRAFTAYRMFPFWLTRSCHRTVYDTSIQLVSWLVTSSNHTTSQMHTSAGDRTIGHHSCAHLCLLPHRLCQSKPVLVPCIFSLGFFRLLFSHPCLHLTPYLLNKVWTTGVDVGIVLGKSRRGQRLSVCYTLYISQDMVHTRLCVQTTVPKAPREIDNPYALLVLICILLSYTWRAEFCCTAGSKWTRWRRHLGITGGWIGAKFGLPARSWGCCTNPVARATAWMHAHWYVHTLAARKTEAWFPVRLRARVRRRIRADYFGSRPTQDFHRLPNLCSAHLNALNVSAWLMVSGLPPKR